MMMKRTKGRELATMAHFALVAFLSMCLTATTHNSVANTLPAVRERPRAPVPAPKDSAHRPDPATPMDGAMGALSPQDAALYRRIFAAQAAHDWLLADTLGRGVVDTRLWGHVLADRLERQNADSAALASWLNQYAALPEAEAFYKRARKAGEKNLRKPETFRPHRAGGDTGGAGNFSPEIFSMDAGGAPSQAVQKALNRKDPWTASALFAGEKAHLKPAAIAATQAALASSFFMVGERDQAAALSERAAAADQPLGLWTRGLIAWERGDRTTARSSFTRLADHSAVKGGNRAAAHFWAHRAARAFGDKAGAQKHLSLAAQSPRSFYGLLAGQLLGRNPVMPMDRDGQSPPLWDGQTQKILLKDPVGWRALALLQVGQQARAQAALFRLDVQDAPEKRGAVEALAVHISMPALSLRFAAPEQEKGWDTALYPLLPWQPEGGFQIDRALLFALARHESLFDPAAISHRGAVGLMQIMPATADALAEKEGVTKDKLHDPAYNMTLGQKYVRHLASQPQIGNNLVLLLAAYNGGPAKAIHWATDHGRMNDPLLFLESIPLRETRHYVARVLSHYWAYSARLGRPLTSLKQMAQGQWPTVSLAEPAALRMAAAQ